MPKSKRGKGKSSLPTTFGLLLIILGIFLIANLADIEVSKIKNEGKFSVTNSTSPIKISNFKQEDSKNFEKPEKIVLPNEQIDIKVVEAPIIDGYWETSEVNASHGEGSAMPGQKGNMVIFAHARVGLFYNLKNVKENDLIYVFTKNKWFQYKVTKTSSVYPNQTEVIAPTKNEELTLYTCSGFADEKRLIVTAVPLK